MSPIINSAGGAAHCGDVPGNVQIPNIFSIVIDIAGHFQTYCELGGLLISDDAY